MQWEWDGIPAGEWQSTQAHPHPPQSTAGQGRSCHNPHGNVTLQARVQENRAGGQLVTLLNIIFFYFTALFCHFKQNPHHKFFHANTFNKPLKMCRFERQKPEQAQPFPIRTRALGRTPSSSPRLQVREPRVLNSSTHTAPAAPPLPALCLTSTATPQKQTPGFPHLTYRTACVLQSSGRDSRATWKAVLFF